MTDLPAVVSPLPDYAFNQPAKGTEGTCAHCGQPAGGTSGVALPQVSAQAAAAVRGSFVYAVGRLHARFPSLGAEKEYAQLVGADSDAIVRTGALKDALADKQNRYLARQMCWVFSGPDADACVVIPRDQSDLDELIDTLTDDEQVVQVLVGSPTIIAASSPCLSAELPVAAPDQLLAFSLDEFLDAMPGPDHDRGDNGEDGEDDGEEKQGEGRANRDTNPWRQTSRGLFNHLTRRSENRGLTDEHRAMNYIALRYPQIYHLVYDAQRDGATLIGVDVRPAFSGGDRRTIDVRFSLRHARTHVIERYRCRVDTTDVFPFLASPLTLIYD